MGHNPHQTGGRGGPEDRGQRRPRGRGSSMEAPQTQNIPPRRAGLSASRKLMLLSGAATLACWGIPFWRGHNLYGHGMFKLAYLYFGIFSGFLWLASIAVILTPTRLRRALT